MVSNFLDPHSVYSESSTDFRENAHTAELVVVSPVLVGSSQSFGYYELSQFPEACLTSTTEKLQF